MSEDNSLKVQKIQAGDRSINIQVSDSSQVTVNEKKPESSIIRPTMEDIKEYDKKTRHIIYLGRVSDLTRGSNTGSQIAPQSRHSLATTMLIWAIVGAASIGILVLVL